MLMFHAGSRCWAARSSPAFHADLAGLYRSTTRAWRCYRGLQPDAADALVGFMLSRYDARKMMMGGLLVLSFSLFHMTNFDLGV